MISENALIESPSLRDEFVDRTEVLDKVKALSMLPDNTHVTIPMAASYYEVDPEAIKWHIKNSHKELESDGLTVLSGEKLREFVRELNYPANILSRPVRARELK